MWNVATHFTHLPALLPNSPALTLTEAVDENEVDNAKLSHILNQHVFYHGHEGSSQLHATGEKDQVKPG